MTGLDTPEFPAPQERVGARPASVVLKTSSATCLVSEMFRGSRSGSRRSSAQRGADCVMTSDRFRRCGEWDDGKPAHPRLETVRHARVPRRCRYSAENCTTCNGSGQMRFQQGFFSVARTCHTCRGVGKVIKTPCKDCRGAGRVEREKQME